MPMIVSCRACGHILYYDTEEAIGPIDVIRRYSINDRCPRCRTKLSPEIPRKIMIEPSRTINNRKNIALKYWYLTKTRKTETLLHNKKKP
jgi:hypothetical protein